MNFELQGTNGVVEVSNSSNAGGWGQGRIAIAAAAAGEASGTAAKAEEWADLATWLESAEADAVLPAEYRSTSAAFHEATKSGHNGSDFYVTKTFLAACRGGLEAGSAEPVGIHEAMDMTLPGLLSQESAASGGCWLPVPNSRDWVSSAANDGPLDTQCIHSTPRAKL